MSRKTIILISIVAVLAVATFAGFLVFNRNNKTTDSTANTIQATPTNNPTNQPTAMPTTQPTVATQTSRYIAYNEDDFAKTDGTKLLFFHAPWCPQCKALDADISKNIPNDSGVTIYKVDYDSNQALRQKYGVTLQTTLVKVDSNGNLVKKYVAYNEPTYANVKANLF